MINKVFCSKRAHACLLIVIEQEEVVSEAMDVRLREEMG